MKIQSQAAQGVHMNGFLSRFRQIPVYGYLILILALLFLFPYLDIRPPHSDELSNGWWVQYMWKHGFFKYNPKYFHGPLYFYLLQLSELIFGFGIWSLRFVNVLFALGNIILIFMHRRFLGNAVFWAGLVLAISPGLSFFSRSAIHETGFIFFQLLFSYGFCYYVFNREQKSVFFIAAGITGLMLTKETWVIFIGTWFIAWALVCVYGRVFKNEFPEKFYPPDAAVKPGDIQFYFLTGIIILLVIYSGFFLNPQGIHDAYKGVAPWLGTGTTNSGHNKPFFYWLQLLLHYEITVPFCIAASVVMLGRFTRLARFWAVFAFGTFLAYSIIPYKTPWCIQNIIWPYSLVFGILISKLFNLKSSRFTQKTTKTAVIIIIIPVIIYSAWLSFKLNFITYDASAEPYNYVQTKKDATQLMDTIQKATQNNPIGENMKICIPLPSPWSCSYLLSRYPNLEYAFENNTSPDILMIKTKDQKKYEKNLVGTYLYKNFIVKEYDDPVTAYFKYELFHKWVPEGMNQLNNSAGIHKDKAE